MHDIKEMVIHLFEVPAKLPLYCLAQGHSFSSFKFHQEHKTRMPPLRLPPVFVIKAVVAH